MGKSRSYTRRTHRLYKEYDEKLTQYRRSLSMWGEIKDVVKWYLFRQTYCPGCNRLTTFTDQSKGATSISHYLKWPMKCVECGLRCDDGGPRPGEFKIP